MPYLDIKNHKKNLLMPLVGIILLSRIAKCSFFYINFHSGVGKHYLLVSNFVVEFLYANNPDMN